MSHRKVGAGRGAAWIVEGLDIVKQNPGTFALMGLVFGAITAVPILGALVSLLGPVFYGGYLAAVRTQDHGGQAQVGQIFDGFSQPGAFMRLLPIVLLSLLLIVVVLLVMAMFMGGEIVRLAQAGGDPTPEDLAALGGPLASSMLILVPLGLVASWTMFLAIPRAMLGEAGGLSAIGDGFRAVWANLLPLIVHSLCWLLIGLVLGIGVVLFTLIGAALGEGLQMVVSFVMSALLMMVVSALYVSSMYRAWVEIFGQAPSQPQSPAAPGSTTTAEF